MIFYFSGCGNSKHVAETIAAGLNDTLVFIPKAARENRYEYTLAEGERLGFVFPVYAWAPPKLVLDFINKMTVKVPKLVEGPASYTFTAKTTDYASRFRLVFSVCGDADGDNAPFAFINNGDIIIVGAEAGAVLQIVDVLGHVVVSTDVARNVSTGGMAKGVYVLRLINGDDVKTQKIVVD